MPDNYEEKLRADSEIERIIQPYSESTISRIIDECKRDEDKAITVCVWNNVLLTSAFLYQKAIDQNVNIRIRQLDFNSKLEAIIFVCMQQLNRKDLTESFHKYLVGRAYISEYFHVNLEKNVSKLQSAMMLATPLKLAAGTVLKYGEYAKAIDYVYSIEPLLSEYILNERIRLSHNNTIELTRIPKDNLKRLLEAIETKGLQKITYADMRFETQYNPPKGLKPSKVIRNEESDEKLAIRQLPAYDPDAQVSSLALTVPSWTSSINRVTDATDFSKISNAARNRLMRSLGQLCESIEIIKLAIEEE